LSVLKDIVVKDILKLMLVQVTFLLTSVDYQRELADFLKQLKHAGIPVRDLLHFYTAIVRPVLEYACPVWHSGLTAGQCNAIENTQKRVIHMVYSDTDSDYETALIVARMYSLKDRREMLMSRFFKKQVLVSNALLHYLLPDRRDNDIIRSLRNFQPFPSIRARTNKFHKSFMPYRLKNFTVSLKSAKLLFTVSDRCIVILYCMLLF